MAAIGEPVSITGAAQRVLAQRQQAPVRADPRGVGHRPTVQRARRLHRGGPVTPSGLAGDLKPGCASPPLTACAQELDPETSRRPRTDANGDRKRNRRGFGVS